MTQQGGAGTETVTVESSGSPITGSGSFNYDEAQTIKITVDTTVGNAYGNYLYACIDLFFITFKFRWGRSYNKFNFGWIRF